MNKKNYVMSNVVLHNVCFFKINNTNSLLTTEIFGKCKTVDNQKKLFWNEKYKYRQIKNYYQF